jgi:maleylacetoacetate isomerase
MRKLYGYFRSSAAYRVRIALGLKGLAYDHAGVNLMPGVSEQKSDDYRALNPQGRVPYLIDGEASLSQSPAILEYLNEAYPAAPLLPADILARARVRQLASLVGCDVHPLNNLSVLTYLKTEFAADKDAVNRWYCHWIVEGFTALEALLAGSEQTGKFCHGDTPGMADIYLVPQLWNARRFSVAVEAFPTIVRIDAACNKLDAFKAALPENQPDAPTP